MCLAAGAPGHSNYISEAVFPPNSSVCDSVQSLVTLVSPCLHLDMLKVTKWQRKSHTVPVLLQQQVAVTVNRCVSISLFRRASRSIASENYDGNAIILIRTNENTLASAGFWNSWKQLCSHQVRRSALSPHFHPTFTQISAWPIKGIK